jgi:hypothetical protein
MHFKFQQNKIKQNKIKQNKIKQNKNQYHDKNENFFIVIL